LDIIVIWVSHGYYTELFRERVKIEPSFYHYGSVNRYEYNNETKEFELIEIDGKYY